MFSAWITTESKRVSLKTRRGKTCVDKTEQNKPKRWENLNRSRQKKLRGFFLWYYTDALPSILSYHDTTVLQWSTHCRKIYTASMSLEIQSQTISKNAPPVLKTRNFVFTHSPKRCFQKRPKTCKTNFKNEIMQKKKERNESLFDFSGYDSRIKEWCNKCLPKMFNIWRRW